LEAAFEALKDGGVADVRVLIDDLYRTGLPLLTDALMPRLRGRLEARPQHERKRMVKDTAGRAHREAAADALTLVLRGKIATIHEMHESYKESLPYAMLQETVRMGED
jgi:hypothetical protein